MSPVATLHIARLCRTYKVYLIFIARKIFKCVYLSLFIITKLFLKYESLILFKLDQLMVTIGKKRLRKPRIQNLKKI